MVEINNWNQNRISNLITKKLFGTLSQKKITILGFAFKANTNDTRESAAIKICRDLIEEGAFLNIHDPKVSVLQIQDALGPAQADQNNKLEGCWRKEDNLYDSFDDSDAVLIITEWKEYFDMDWNRISSYMRRPAWVFDARSVVNPNEVINAGLKLWRIGDGS